MSRQTYTHQTPMKKASSSLHLVCCRRTSCFAPLPETPPRLTKTPRIQGFLLVSCSENYLGVPKNEGLKIHEDPPTQHQKRGPASFRNSRLKVQRPSHQVNICSEHLGLPGSLVQTSAHEFALRSIAETRSVLGTDSRQLTSSKHPGASLLEHVVQHRMVSVSNPGLKQRKQTEPSAVSLRG